LKHLKTLTKKKQMAWQGIIKNLENEESRGKWSTTDPLSTVDFTWRPIVWTLQDYPDWNAPELHAFLRMWEIGHRRIGKRVQDDQWQGKIRYRFIASPICDAIDSFNIY
jgi:hypothetical protein